MNVSERKAIGMSVAESIYLQELRSDPWSFEAFQFYADVFRTATKSTISDPKILAEDISRMAHTRPVATIDGRMLAPLIKCDPTPEYTNIIVWENAPLMACDRPLLRVYLEMALNLTKPVGILGNVVGIRPNVTGIVDMFSDESEITTDIFILVHREDLPLFMRPRSIQMGLRFYDELICQGKQFSVVPEISVASITDESYCPSNIWTTPKN